NVQRGLHFGDFGPGDQGAYAEFYEGAFTIVRGQPLFNWRPYWRSRRADPAILHLALGSAAFRLPCRSS
ncbi:hypothetical protein, partial [Sphingomonas sp.]|uniref:hypothetical protein n=1 Tax=Sphingomonas sp. TaxID=28214 RepID=UPI0025840938